MLSKKELRNGTNSDSCLRSSRRVGVCLTPSGSIEYPFADQPIDAFDGETPPCHARRENKAVRPNNVGPVEENLVLRGIDARNRTRDQNFGTPTAAEFVRLLTKNAGARRLDDDANGHQNYRTHDAAHGDGTRACGDRGRDRDSAIGTGEQTAAIKVMRLSDWMALAEFEQALAGYFNEPRPAAELADYRAKREAVKKPRDEVVPVLHHVKFKAKGERHSVPYGAHG
jgi:hypothetical protein